jgi:hypothetical protein
VLRCGLDAFHFLISDGERWRNAGHGFDSTVGYWAVSWVVLAWSMVPLVNREG